MKNYIHTKMLKKLLEGFSSWREISPFVSVPPLALDMRRKPVLRSALQKAIRRGEYSQAIQYSQELAALNCDYFWRALAIIAVEDVGHIDLTSWTLAMSKRAFREAILQQAGNPETFLRFLVSQLCSRPKTRACCELSISMDLATPDLPAWNASREKPWNQLIVDTVGSSIFGAYRALAILRGMSPDWMPQQTLVPETLTLDAVTIAFQAAFDTEVEGILEGLLLCVESPLDSMHLAMPPLALRMKNSACELVADDMPVSQRIGGFGAEAYDMHTEIGRGAILGLYEQLGNLSTYRSVVTRIPRHRASRALGAVIFIEEGALLDRRMRTCWLDALRGLQDATLATSYGVPEGSLTELREIVRIELPRLHAERERVVSRVSWLSS